MNNAWGNACTVLVNCLLIYLPNHSTYVKIWNIFWLLIFKNNFFKFFSGTISQKDLKDLITNNQSGGIVDIPSDQLPIDSKELINDFNPGDLNIVFSKL